MCCEVYRTECLYVSFLTSLIVFPVFIKDILFQHIAFQAIDLVLNGKSSFNVKDPTLKQKIDHI